ncbi:hypothetical protein [Bacillus sp. PBL-C9]|uniref:hypothetical protein n=1 Tax=Bacillus sp. PBL-C9 TaxID=3097548 RepID=UPI002A245E02|nr:hypothetical protein [Bacillus sp. PBL-C9]MDX9640278.1 hypothetical protein [Bacillus sp. PBL-C9]
MLDRCFGFLKSRKMYSDIKDFALEAAEYFRRAGRFEMATKHAPFATEKLNNVMSFGGLFVIK